MKSVFRTIKRCLAILEPAERKRLVWLFFAVMLMSVVELLGVVSILPFMSVATNPEIIQKSSFLNQVFVYFEFESERSFLIFLGFGALVALILGNTVKALSSYLLLRFSNMQNHYLGKRIFENYLSQPYEYFLSYNSSDLSKMVLGEVGQVVNGVITPLLKGAGRICTVIFISLMLIYVNPVVALVMGAVLSIAYFLVYTFFKKKITQLGKERARVNQVRFKLINEASGGIKEVKLMNKESVYLNDFDRPSLSFAYTQVHNSVVGTIPKYFLEAIAFGGMLSIVIYLISQEGQAQAISLTALYAFAGYKLMPALQEIFSAVTKIRFSLPVLAMVEKSLDKNKASCERKNLLSHKEIIFKNEIQLNDLSFKYQAGSKPILDRIDFKIGFNTTTGIIGPTGSGKTTLVDLILGLLRPSSGDILIDGIKLEESNLPSWQKQIGYVPQFIYLSDNSIESNIAFGIPKADIDNERLVESAKLAQIHDFVLKELPQGYQTIVGERGIRLSGGQRQRIGVARALYHQPSLLVFDEATSALDLETEKAIIESIESLSGKKTIIMIAHRLSTLERADQIIKVQNGKVISQKKEAKVLSH